MKLLSLYKNLALKLAHKWSMKWLSKERKDTYCQIRSKKDQKLRRKFTFNIPKFKFQNGLEQKTSNCWALLRQIGLWEPNPPKICKYFCRFWILWIMRIFWHMTWYVIKMKWWCNIFSHIFHANVVITGKPSYKKTQTVAMTKVLYLPHTSPGISGP